MRQGSNAPRRPRSRHNNGGGGGGPSGNNGGGGNGGGGQVRRQNVPLRHQTFDSNGPDVRVRGTAIQVYEKYQALARDAASTGDRIAAENYLQHAEHYYRIVEVINEQAAQEQARNPPRHQQQPNMNGQQPQAGYGDGMDQGQQPQPQSQPQQQAVATFTHQTAEALRSPFGDEPDEQPALDDAGPLVARG
jgi:hypothetical protein